jgi:Zn-dependent M28 family amino/carboxypeptidase
MRRILVLVIVVAAFVGLLAYVEKAPAQSADKFDSNRAWEHLRQLVTIGPRPAGSAGMRQTRAYITRQISAMGLTVQEQSFIAETPQGKIEMVNLVVRLAGKRPEKILVTGHYDTKFFRDQVFVGANDGGSSGAFLIELARVLKDRPREWTYELVWFDGEEAFCMGWTDCGTPASPDNTYGSRYYVRQAQEAKAIGTLKAMILVDMIADRDLVIKRESNSTPWLKDIIWSAAKRVGHGGTFVDVETDIEDDHFPFLKAGVPAVDIIDLEYPAWHHTSGTDTLDKVSARSMQIVGDVLLAALPDIEKRLAK